MPSGDQIANIRLATTRRWKKDGQRQEETEWHRVTFFGGLAKVAGEYLKKGSQCYVEGRIKTNKFTGSDGVEKYSTSIIVEDLRLMDSKGESSGPRSDPGAYQGATQQPAASQSGGGYDDWDDDIPFDSLNWQIRSHLI
jgi:single-strand DNA-binding protein